VTIVIAGAGVIGASIAWHLAAGGVRDIIVVDRENGPGGGSTSKATGGFRAQFGTEVNVRLSLMSRDKLLRFQEEIGADPGYQPSGYLFLARNDDELRELRTANGVQRRCGVTAAQIISGAEARKLNPAIRGDIAGAAFCAIDGFIRPMQILNGYITAAKRLGVKFQFGVRDLERLPQPRILVNAAGAWAADICDVPVTPLRRRVACTVETDVLPDNMPMTIWPGDGFHLRVRDHRVMLLWPDQPPNDDVWQSEMLRRAHERVPVLRDIPIDPAHCWSGFYEMSPDRHAILGPHPTLPDVFLANGSSGHGVMHAPAIGQLLAEMITGHPTSIDVHALRPSRFAENDPVIGPELL
jgi:sarcosine oxidase, subunit beta